MEGRTVKKVIRRISCILLLVTPLAWGASSGSVEVAPPDVHGSRPVEPLTEKAVIRDYLASWKSMQFALEHNDAQTLSQDFTGTALSMLTHTVESQSRLRLHTVYQHPSHHLQIIFYSPNGISIQLVDTTGYKEILYKDCKAIGSRQMQTRYIAVLTPAATRWMVRVL